MKFKAEKRAVQVIFTNVRVLKLKERNVDLDKIVKKYEKKRNL